MGPRVGKGRASLMQSQKVVRESLREFLQGSVRVACVKPLVSLIDLGLDSPALVAINRVIQLEHHPVDATAIRLTRVGLGLVCRPPTDQVRAWFAPALIRARSIPDMAMGRWGLASKSGFYCSMRVDTIVP